MAHKLMETKLLVFNISNFIFAAADSRKVAGLIFLAANQHDQIICSWYSFQIPLDQTRV